MAFLNPVQAYENHLSRSQQNNFLNAIQNAGLDTWHEGDFQYKYISAGCNFKLKECWAYVEMKYQGHKQTAYCYAEEVENFSQVYDQKTKRITQFFYDSILECMSTFPE